MRIELDGVRKTYGGEPALDRVSLVLEPGQIVAVLGANGAGKSTLLRALAGVVGPDRGEILLDGEPFRRDRLDQRRRLMFLPDFPPLLAKESVLRNLAVWVELYEAWDRATPDRVLGLLDGFDLLGHADAPAGTLSRGQAYKVAVTALVAIDPELWLMDEPMASGMDPRGLGLFRKEVHAAVGRGRTLVYTTQMLEVAEKFADRVCILDRGRVRAFSTFAELSAPGLDATSAIAALMDGFREEAE